MEESRIYLCIMEVQKSTNCHLKGNHLIIWWYKKQGYLIKIFAKIATKLHPTMPILSINYCVELGFQNMYIMQKVQHNMLRI